MPTLSPSAQDYLNKGGVLTNGQIPQDSVPSNPPTNINGTITGSLLEPTTGLPYRNPNPVPAYPVNTLDSNIPANAAQTTPTEGAANDLTSRLLKLNESLLGKSTFQTQQEQAAGLPELQATQNDLSAKLKSLQNEALAIPQQLQQEATGRGITTAGLQPIQTAALRNNAIQALGVSSLLEASKGNIANAQALADKAVAQKFQPIQEKIDAAKANLDLIMKSPQYSLEEKNRAQAQLDIQNKKAQDLATQQENAKTAHAMATAAITNNPGDAAAQFNAQQVLKLDPTQPDYLQKAFALVGNYQTNPTAVQNAILQNQKTVAEINKLNADAKNNGQSVAVLNGQLTVNGVPISQYVSNTDTGKNYLDISQITDKKEASVVEKAARLQGIQVLNKDQADQMQNIDVARSNADKILTVVSNFAPSSALSRLVVGPENKLSEFFQTNSDIASFNSYRSAAIEAMRAMAGSKGLRINNAEITLATNNDIPKITDTIGVANQKIANLKAQLQSWEDALIPNRQTPVVSNTQNNQIKVRNIQTGEISNYNGSLTPEEAKAAGYEIVQ